MLLESLNIPLTIAARISSSSSLQVSTRQLAVEFLSKGISNTLNIGTDGTQTPTTNERHID